MTKEEIINNLPQEVIKKFSSIEIIKNNISLVSNKLAINTVYKIKQNGDINTTNHEEGYLYLPKNSGIKEHQHTIDTEAYTLIKGTLKVKGVPMTTNFCDINDYHQIDIVNVDTIIHYEKKK